MCDYKPTCKQISDVLIQLAEEKQAELDTAAARKKTINRTETKKETCKKSTISDDECDPTCKLIFNESPIVTRRLRRINALTDKKLMATFLMKEAMKLDRLFKLRDRIIDAVKKQSQLIIETVGMDELLKANEQIDNQNTDDDPDEEQLPDLRLID